MVWKASDDTQQSRFARAIAAEQCDGEPRGTRIATSRSAAKSP